MGVCEVGVGVCELSLVPGNDVGGCMRCEVGVGGVVSNYKYMCVLNLKANFLTDKLSTLSHTNVWGPA